eukprot:m.89441 g.89441  ORF g.89441 m.89441 type:complete len:510 (-) comp18121_c1_seq1:128-1657(-)
MDALAAQLDSLPLTAAKEKLIEETRPRSESHTFLETVAAHPVKKSAPEVLKRFCQVLKRYQCGTYDFAGPSGLKSIASGIILEEGLDDSFYIVDLMNTFRLYKAWTEAMPRVEPFYAVKCCPEPSIIETLVACGTGFDCASAAEIELVLQCGARPEQIIFAQPCKRPSDLRLAKARGVMLSTFDCVAELEKVAKIYPEMEVVLRIRADDPSAELPLGAKFGAHMDEVDVLLSAAKDLGLAVVGVSFHVGSLARDPNAFSIAIELARSVFDKAERLGFDMRLLDLGGGFTGRFDSSGCVVSMQGDIPTSINTALAKHFADSKIRVIAEPGRYFAEASMHLLTHIHGRRERVEPIDSLARASAATASSDTADDTMKGSPYMEYWISDGLYGSFNGVIYDHAVPRAWLMPSPSLPPLENPSTLVRSTVFGPTCDSLDVVFKDVLLPKLRIGDWLLFPSFGAYSLAGATNFNGVQAASCNKFYICSKHGVDDFDSLVMWACEMTTKPCSLVAL